MLKYMSVRSKVAGHAIKLDEIDLAKLEEYQFPGGKLGDEGIPFCGIICRNDVVH